jgi:hypothetical protein
VEREKFSSDGFKNWITQIFVARLVLPFEWNGATGQPQRRFPADRRDRRLQRPMFEARSFTLGDLPLYALHQYNQLFGLVVPFGLFAHLLEVLRSVGDTIRHWGSVLKK